MSRGSYKRRINFQMMVDLLSLVDRKLSRAVFYAWTEEQRQEAQQYATAAHLRASDNPVRVPPIPVHVVNLPKFPFPESIWQ